jgi:hypothetical protein
VLVAVTTLEAHRDDLEKRRPLHPRSRTTPYVMIEHRPLQEPTLIGQPPRVR